MLNLDIIAASKTQQELSCASQMEFCDKLARHANRMAGSEKSAPHEKARKKSNRLRLPFVRELRRSKALRRPVDVYVRASADSWNFVLALVPMA